MKINWDKFGGWISWLIYSIGAYILLIPFFKITLKTLCGSIIIGFFAMLLNTIIQLINKKNKDC